MAISPNPSIADITIQQAAEMLAKRACAISMAKQAGLFKQAVDPSLLTSNPALLTGLAGAGGALVGGLGGYGLGALRRKRDEDAASPWSTALTGALAGGALGTAGGAIAGYGHFGPQGEVEEQAAKLRASLQAQQDPLLIGAAKDLTGRFLSGAASSFIPWKHPYEFTANMLTNGQRILRGISGNKATAHSTVGLQAALNKNNPDVGAAFAAAGSEGQRAVIALLAKQQPSMLTNLKAILKPSGDLSLPPGQASTLWNRFKAVQDPQATLTALKAVRGPTSARDALHTITNPQGALAPKGYADYLASHDAQAKYLLARIRHTPGPISGTGNTLGRNVLVDPVQIVGPEFNGYHADVQTMLRNMAARGSGKPDPFDFQTALTNTAGTYQAQQAQQAVDAFQRGLRTYPVHGKNLNPVMREGVASGEGLTANQLNIGNLKAPLLRSGGGFRFNLKGLLPGMEQEEMAVEHGIPGTGMGLLSMIGVPVASGLVNMLRHSGQDTPVAQAAAAYLAKTDPDTLAQIEAEAK